METVRPGLNRCAVAVMGLALLGLLAGCSPGGDPSSASIDDVTESASQSDSATLVRTTDVCALADSALAASEPSPTVLIPEAGLDSTWRSVTPSTGQNEISEVGETVAVSCNLLYDGTTAISLVVALSFDPDRDFSEPDPGEMQESTVGPVELSGFLGYAEPPEPLTLKLDESTYLDVTVYDEAARYQHGEDNLSGAVMPIAREIAALWAAGDIPILGDDTAEESAASLDWADPRSICGAIDAGVLGSMLGIDSATQSLSIESTSGTDSGSNGLVADIVYCTYEATPYRDDPLYPHRVEVHVYRYDTPEQGAQAFSAFAGYGAACPSDGVAVMYECEGGQTTTATFAGRLMPYIQTFDGAPSSVDANALQSQVLTLGSGVLLALAEFS